MSNSMIPQNELEELLRNRLKDSITPQQIELLLGDVTKLSNEWEEMDVTHKEMGYSMSVNCPDICWLADQVYQGARIRMFRKKKV